MCINELCCYLHSLFSGQKYIDEAEKDKCRYIEELKAYQNSEAYQAFLKRRAINKVKKLCGKRENNSLILFFSDKVIF